MTEIDYRVTYIYDTGQEMLEHRLNEWGRKGYTLVAIKNDHLYIFAKEIKEKKVNNMNHKIVL